MSPQQRMLDRAHARHNDPETSHEAAEVVSVKIGSLQAQVLSIFVIHGDMTDEGACKRLPSMGDATLRGRRSELVHGGYLKCVSRHGMTKRGNRSTIWGATDAGRKMYESISRSDCPSVSDPRNGNHFQ